VLLELQNSVGRKGKESPVEDCCGRFEAQMMETAGFSEAT
jgi:hypothetical protein